MLKTSSGLLELISCLRSLGCDACEHVISKPRGATCQFRTQRTTASQLQWLALFWVVRRSQRTRLSGGATVVIFFFPYNPPHPPYPEGKPPTRPTPKSLISVHFGSVWLRFGSVWLRLAPFQVCFRSVSGPFRGVGWDRGGVGERGFCKGKEYH